MKLRNKIMGAVVALSSLPAMAATGGTALPWEGPLQTLQRSLSGPVATSIALIAFFAAGAALVFGEDMGQFARKAILAVIVVAFMMMANSVLTALGLTGAMLVL